MLTERTNQFIMFGCWNSLNADNGLEKTMATLSNHIQDYPVDFIAVAGDNYYPDKGDKKEKKGKEPKEGKKEKEKDKKEKEPKEGEKEKEKKPKTKKIIPANLLRGFDLLPKDVPIKMILGNHDLETNVPSKMELMVEDELEDAGKCSILSLEHRGVDLNQNIQFGLMNSKFMNNTLVLMIDTSIYDPDDAEFFLECYKKELNDENASVSSIILKQHNFINAEIARHPATPNLIIIGHHPITAIKNKNGENKLIEPFPLFITELRKLGEYPHITNITYLCADLHLYQHGVVTIFGSEKKHSVNYDSSTSGNMESIRNDVTIRQYVVGSGGTALDPLITSDSEIKNKNANILEYQLLENMPYSHGFLRCNCNRANPTFQFISSSDIGLGTRKRRQRTTKRKGSKRKQTRQKSRR